MHQSIPTERRPSTTFILCRKKQHLVIQQEGFPKSKQHQKTDRLNIRLPWWKQKVQGNLKVAQDRQKSQEDIKRTQKEFQVGEHVFIKVKPKESSLKLGSCAKLAPRYCGPFEILSRMGQVAYQLDLPPNLKVHNVFHIFVLKRYVHDATHVINWNDAKVEPKGFFWWNCIVSSKGGGSCFGIAPFRR